VTGFLVFASTAVTGLESPFGNRTQVLMLAAEEWFLTAPGNPPHILRSMNSCNDGKDYVSTLTGLTGQGRRS